MRYWLMKSEPSAFSIQDLRKVRNQTTSWDGVRNFQARNFMRTMKMGVAEVVAEAYPDDTAFDPKDIHYDSRSTQARPLWDMVDIKLVRIFRSPIPLDRLRQEPGLKRMELLRKGSRLSVQPVRPEEWKIVLELAES